jgi:hypothetical protein
VPSRECSAPFLPDDGGDPLGEGGDGLRLVQAQRFRDDGPIGDVEVAVAEDLTGVVTVRLGLDDAGDVERPHLGLTGLGLRIQGEVITRKTGVDLGSLMAVGVAAKLGQIQGRLSVAALGMSSPEITALFPLPSVIVETSIQRALEAIAVIKSKLGDTATTLTPQFVAVRITNPEAFGSI